MDERSIGNFCSQKVSEILTPHIFNGLQKLFEKAKELNKEQPCKMFQLCLRRIPELPLSVLEEDYKTLLEHNRLDPEWFHQLLVGVFATIAKLNLISHGASRNLRIRKKDLQVPDNLTLVHKCYIESAREFFETPYLFSNKFDPDKQRENTDRIKDKIDTAIQTCLVKQIPLQSLQNKYITNAPSMRGSTTDLDNATDTTPTTNSRSNDNNNNHSIRSSHDSGDELKRELKLDNISNIENEDLDLDLNLKFQKGGTLSKNFYDTSSQLSKKSKLSDDAKSTGTTPVNFAKNRLSRDNLIKLQKELANQPTSNSTRKSKLLDQLLQKGGKPKPKTLPNLQAEPYSTFDLSLDSNEVNKKNPTEINGSTGPINVGGAIDDVGSTGHRDEKNLIMVESIEVDTNGETGISIKSGTPEEIVNEIMGPTGIYLDGYSPTGGTGVDQTGLDAWLGPAEVEIQPKITRIKRIVVHPGEDPEVHDICNLGQIEDNGDVINFPLGLTGDIEFDDNQEINLNQHSLENISGGAISSEPLDKSKTPFSGELLDKSKTPFSGELLDKSKTPLSANISLGGQLSDSGSIEFSDADLADLDKSLENLSNISNVSNNSQMGGNYGRGPNLLSEDSNIKDKQIKSITNMLMAIPEKDLIKITSKFIPTNPQPYGGPAKPLGLANRSKPLKPKNGKKETIIVKDKRQNNTPKSRQTAGGSGSFRGAGGFENKELSKSIITKKWSLIKELSNKSGIPLPTKIM